MDHYKHTGRRCDVSRAVQTVVSANNPSPCLPSFSDCICTYAPIILSPQCALSPHPTDPKSARISGKDEWVQRQQIAKDVTYVIV